ncbi:phosphoribosyl-AMP cyclohydrolase [Candidatus Hecatella orcuttiae]|jgi:phosphoribosyl-AMP cyclohydrolase|uniref:phosphoribosyl-AMP cyclohydrolase n=1 Tax=Candidatus Hecatella orcuttiae TaxID=1935119 RepID=UPI002867C768|nr:phosphoribosyl-AMP cyclohydrolase [Candidatus Hecatella orcuttiae]
MKVSNLPLGPEEARKVAGQLNYRHNGRVTVVVQDSSTGEVLMVASANREAVEKTLTTGMMYYWSTERNRLWQKGETSGHYQFLKELYVDCDFDALLVKVRQIGGACHRGYRTCFYRKLEGATFKEEENLK